MSGRRRKFSVTSDMVFANVRVWYVTVNHWIHDKREQDLVYMADSRSDAVRVARALNEAFEKSAVWSA